MEKRIGAALIIVEDKHNVAKLNNILSEHSDVIIARQGLPVSAQGISIISLVLEGTNSQLNALTGPIGKLSGIKVKSMLMPLQQSSSTL